MNYDANEMETRAVLNTASRMCAAARTAPKAKGVDRLVTMVLTGADKDAVADRMEQLAEPMGYGFFIRDAGNVRDAQALVLIGSREGQRGLNEGCRHCHYENCADCAEHGGLCAFDAIDMGIAIGSAVSVAADDRVDNRVLFSAGRAVQEMGLMGEGVGLVHAIPLSVAGKSPFYDRKPKK